jgi:hypothetical protein
MGWGRDREREKGRREGKAVKERARKILQRIQSHDSGCQQTSGSSLSTLVTQDSQ